MDMSPHFFIMLIIAILCGLDSFIWWWQNHPADAATFLCFGLGYVFLGIVFGGIK